MLDVSTSVRTLTRWAFPCATWNRYDPRSSLNTACRGTDHARRRPNSITADTRMPASRPAAFAGLSGATAPTIWVFGSTALCTCAMTAANGVASPCNGVSVTGMPARSWPLSDGSICSSTWRIAAVQLHDDRAGGQPFALRDGDRSDHRVERRLYLQGRLRAAQFRLRGQP